MKGGIAMPDVQMLLRELYRRWMQAAARPFFYTLNEVSHDSQCYPRHCRGKG